MKKCYILMKIRPALQFMVVISPSTVNETFPMGIEQPVVLSHVHQPYFAVTLQPGKALPHALRWQPPLTAQILLSRDLLSQSLQEDAPEQVLLYGETAKGLLPLVWQGKEGFNFALDMSAWLAIMQQETYRPVHGKPFYASLPFHYKKVPALFRTGAEYIIQRLPSRAARATLFTPFNIGGELLTHLWQGASRHGPCVILTHDMESAVAFDWIDPIMALEGEVGWVAEWMVIPRLYPIDHQALKRLLTAGHHIGLHGIWHSNAEPFLAPERLQQEFTALKPFMEDYAIQGYRGPGWFRTHTLDKVLADFFQYDLTVLDNDFCCPAMPGGVGSSRPFRRSSGLAVLPCSLPFEAPLFRGVEPEQLVSYWSPKLDYLRRTGGVVLINTHPEPGYLARPGMPKAYGHLLHILRQQGWQAMLPSTFVQEWL
ncbi:MAG: hypothetical protein G8345_09315 [Magnetococcales bacterium]|nr:hypothetical protein [Magnetococcales bacterium]NGZ27074.1 hypothetical protein [Magnetococcales bacterium]